jgi:hypothetical protein
MKEEKVVERKKVDEREEGIDGRVESRKKGRRRRTRKEGRKRKGRNCWERGV